MSHATTMATVLLIATAVGAVGHHASNTPTSSLTLTAFVQTEAHTRPLPAPLLRPASRAAAPTLRTRGPVYKVTATAYNALPAQTDDEPFVTADNSFIAPDYSSKLRWLAISRDLLKHWGGRIKYGDQVRVSGVSPELDGIYTVHDTMNKRHHHCIDILSNPSEKYDIFMKGVKMQRVEVRWPLSTPQLMLASSRAKRPTSPPASQERLTESADYLTASIL